MRKYFLGTLAIGMAIGLSAFSNPSAKPSKLFATFYWYNSSTGAILNGGVKSEQPSSACTTAGANCAVGFTNQTTTPLTDPPQASRSHNP